MAIRYHELKSKVQYQDKALALRRMSARAILEKAQAILGSITHTDLPSASSFHDIPGSALRIEFDIEETLENSATLLLKNQALGPDDLYATYVIPKKQALVLSVDTSLSMTGEKLALTAVALAVVLIQFPEDPIGIVAFETKAKILKQPEERISIQTLVERFLDIPAQGYTHLEDGLRTSLTLERQARRQAHGTPAATLLLTDGKYTAGRDPAYLAPRFNHLVVMKMGKEKASLPICEELARLGGGNMVEVEELAQLPQKMYGVVKDLLRSPARLR